MSFEHDAELRELFRQEVTDRVAELLRGSQAMMAGNLDAELAGTMFREGHTIKGTARVMGFDMISRGGQALEATWRRVQHGDLRSTPELAEALGAVARLLPDALDGDIPDLQDALNRLNSAVAVAEGPEPAPDPAPATPPAPQGNGAPVAPDEPAPPSGDTPELGGLLNALDTWAAEESARVNAGQMYRLINTVASLGIHAEGLNRMVVAIADAADRGTAITEQTQQLAEAVGALERSVTRARETALSLAAAQLKEITNTFPQLINYLAKKTGKEIRFELVGDEESVDRQVLERLADPLRQLVVNAIEHGVEKPAERADAGKAPTAVVAIRATIKDHRLEVVVEDDGRGVDWAAVHRSALRKGLLPEGAPPDEGALRALLFSPGFSTANQPSELVGDGTGLTAVSEAVDRLRGSLDFETNLGHGTKVTVVVPTWRALQDAVLVRAAGHNWGIPEPAVVELVDLNQSDHVISDGLGTLTWLDQQIPAASFGTAVGLADHEEATHAVIVRSTLGPVALLVADVIGQRQVAAKELGPILGGAQHITGAALLGGGDVVVLVDPVRLAERARELPVAQGPRPKVLVVDDSQGARQVVAGALASDGFEASVAANADEALSILASTAMDALVVDYSMPGPDGIDLVSRVRERFGFVPVIMLSGVATPEDQGRARNAGVDAYFDKADFREGALAATLRSLVENRRKETA